MEKKISYVNRTYADYKDALIEISKRYYPDLTTSFNDASIAAWQIDMTADIADNLSYHIDRVFQETNINSAQEKSSLYAMARNNGVKIPGPKGSIAEVRISVMLNNEDGSDGPIIKRGTKFSSGSQQFELLDDVDFASQFNVHGISDRTITPRVTSNGIINGFNVTKLAIVVAGETKIFTQKISASDVKPFMEITLPIEGVMNIESILVDNRNVVSIPTYGLFYGDGCDDVTRFYEVDNLAQNKCWLDEVDNNGTAKIQEVSGTTLITRGAWRPVNNKFITEYTDRGYLKIIFGAGEEQSDINEVTLTNKWPISKILYNNSLGALPKANSYIYILYRVGGGVASNVAKGAINKISYLNAEFRNKNNTDIIMKSLKVENTTPSFSGKDMPSEQEIRYYIKYHNAAQERCVTVKDYIDRILLLPPKYGTPFRVGVTEENNKIIIYLLGIDDQRKLSTLLPVTLVENIKNYLSEYKMLGDCLEIKSGKIINIGFDIEAIIDKNFNEKNVISSIINVVEEYMDINKHMMGEEIYIGDLQKEIGKIDGVLNLITIVVKNKFGDGYSGTKISQPVIDNNISGENIIDLEASDWVLYNDGDTMMEIKDPNADITVKVKLR